MYKWNQNDAVRQTDRHTVSCWSGWHSSKKAYKLVSEYVSTCVRAYVCVCACMRVHVLCASSCMRAPLSVHLPVSVFTGMRQENHLF